MSRSRCPRDALKIDGGRIDVNGPGPLPPSETAVVKLADARLPDILMAPSAEVLVIVPLPLLYNFAGLQEIAAVGGAAQDNRAAAVERNRVGPSGHNCRSPPRPFAVLICANTDCSVSVVAIVMLLPFTVKIPPR